MNLLRVALLLMVVGTAHAECDLPETLDVLNEPISSGPNLPDSYSHEVEVLNAAFRMAFIGGDSRAVVLNRRNINEAMFKFRDNVARIVARGQAYREQLDEAKRKVLLNCPMFSGAAK